MKDWQVEVDVHGLAIGLMEEVRIAQFFHHPSRAAPWFGSRGE
jgi:hypothetical protein